VPIRVVVVASRVITREGLRTMLETTPDITVVGIAEDVTNGMRAWRTTRADLIIVDLPSAGEIVEAVRRMCAGAKEGPKVVAIYYDEGPEIASALLAEGAAGLVSQDADAREIILAAEAAVRGHLYLTPCLTGDLLLWARSEPPRVEPSLKPRVNALTDREREVLATLACGYSLEETAQELFISHATVRTHVYRMRHKLGVRDRAELVSFAFRAGVISTRCAQSAKAGIA
jgi:DNA-binding NarL/FixJ family response regulator